MIDLQPELPLPPPPLKDDQPYVPARMVHEFQYCPRLAYLEWVQGEWAETANTVEGSGAHRRVDRGPAELPEAGAIGEDERIHARSVTLSSDRLGLIARLDLIEIEDGAVVPVEYKRGRRPHVAAGAWEPERVQLCVQGLILEDNGYRCGEGALYFRESRERVRVLFDAELRSQALAAVSGLRLVAAGARIPPPLEDSPKCPCCSLVSICMPEEVNYLRHGVAPRPLAVGRELSLPVYEQASPARVRKRGETLLIQTEDGGEATARLGDISQFVVVGAVDVTAPVLHELMRREIAVSWYSSGGWFLEHTIGTGHRNVELRTAQYRASFDPGFCLRLARPRRHQAAQRPHAPAPQCPRGKPARGGPRRVAARRPCRRRGEEPGRVARRRRQRRSAAIYFGSFGAMLGGSAKDGEPLRFEFETRNRRPATDPVNAMLSFAYAMLVRGLTSILSAVGFDPYRGF
jgi:CRISPR-associated protein Cas4